MFGNLINMSQLKQILRLFADRGRNEPRFNHDFEDIVYVLDNRVDIADQLLVAPQNVKTFLKYEFKKMMNDKVKQEAIFRNLFYES